MLLVKGRRALNAIDHRPPWRLLQPAHGRRPGRDPGGQIGFLQVQGAASFWASLANIISQPAAATCLDETPWILYNLYFNRSSFNTAAYCANNRAALEYDADRAYERLNYYDLMRREER